MVAVEVTEIELSDEIELADDLHGREVGLVNHSGQRLLSLGVICQISRDTGVMSQSGGAIPNLRNQARRWAGLPPTKAQIAPRGGECVQVELYRDRLERRSSNVLWWPPLILRLVKGHRAVDVNFVTERHVDYVV